MLATARGKEAEIRLKRFSQALVCALQRLAFAAVFALDGAGQPRFATPQPLGVSRRLHDMDAVVHIWAVEATPSARAPRKPHAQVLVSTRILGRRTVTFAPFLIPYRVPHGFYPRS